MATQIEICNAAIAKVGGPTITSLSDDVEAARLCNKFYVLVRDRLLRSHPWNFAIKREELAEIGTAPEFGYARQFQLPSDCLRILEMEGQIYENYKIEGRAVLTDASVCKVKYVFKETDESKWDSFFVDVMATALAAEIAYPLTQSRETKSDMEEELKGKIREARSYDAQEGVLDVVEANSWLDARY